MGKQTRFKQIAIATTLGASLFVTSAAIPFNVYSTPTKAYAAQQAAINFSDVSPKMVAYQPIMELTQKNIIKGYDDGKFKPSVTVTRGQVAAFLARALNLSAGESNFKDVPKSLKLYKEISAAAQAGIITGYSNGQFKPDDAVKRQDIALMIDRAMQKKGSYTDTKNLEFKDTASIPAYTKESIARMSAYGIIQGKADNSFDPAASADRQQTAMFIHRMMNVLEGKEAIEPPAPEKPVTPPVEETTPPPVEVPTPPPVVEPGDKVNVGDHYKTEYEEVIAPGAVLKPVVTYTNPIEVATGEQYKITYPVTYPKGVTDQTSFKDMSVSEIEDIIGQYRYIARIDGKIVEVNIVEEMYNLALKNAQHPKQFKQFRNYFTNWRPETNSTQTSYPGTEVISVNGVPYKDTVYSNIVIDEVTYLGKAFNATIPTAPTENGKFKIDLHTYTNDSVTYMKNKAYPTYLTKTPVLTGTLGENEDFIVDLKSIFNQTEGLVKMDGYTIKYDDTLIQLAKNSNQVTVNGNTITLPVIVTENNQQVYGPIKAISKALGLEVRSMVYQFNAVYDNVPKLEIANYHLEKDGMYWAEGYKK